MRVWWVEPPRSGRTGAGPRRAVGWLWPRSDPRSGKELEAGRRYLLAQAAARQIIPEPPVSSGSAQQRRREPVEHGRRRRDLGIPQQRSSSDCEAIESTPLTRGGSPDVAAPEMSPSQAIDGIDELRDC